MLKGEENELPGRGGKPVFRVRPTSLTLGRPYTLNLSIPICDVWIIRPMWRGITENLCRVAALVALRARTLWRPWVAVMGSEGRGPAWHLPLLLQGTQVTPPSALVPSISPWWSMESPF